MGVKFCSKPWVQLYGSLGICFLMIFEFCNSVLLSLSLYVTLIIHHAGVQTEVLAEDGVGWFGGRRTSSVPLGVPVGVCMAPKQLSFSPCCNINLPVSSVRAAGKGRREQRWGLAYFSVIGFPV